MPSIEVYTRNDGDDTHPRNVKLSYIVSTGDVRAVFHKLDEMSSIWAYDAQKEEKFRLMIEADDLLKSRFFKYEDEKRILKILLESSSMTSNEDWNLVLDGPRTHTGKGKASLLEKIEKIEDVLIVSSKSFNYKVLSAES